MTKNRMEPLLAEHAKQTAAGLALASSYSGGASSRYNARPRHASASRGLTATTDQVRTVLS